MAPLAAILPFLLLPIGGFALAGWRREPTERRLADLLLLGPLALTLAMGALSLLGVECSRTSVAAVVIAAALLRAGFAWRARSRRPIEAAARREPGGAAVLLLALAAGVLAVAVSIRRPITISDPVLIYGAAAAQYAAHGRVDPALLRDVPELEHPDYPPLFPATLAWLQLARGGFDPWIGKPLGGIFLAGLLLELAAIARALGLRKSRAFAAAAFGLVPALVSAADDGYADLVVTACLAGALASLLELAASREETGRRTLRAGLFLAAAALSKNEGFAIGLAMVLLAALLRTTSGARAGARRLLLAAAPMLLAVAAWWIAVARAGLVNDLVEGAGDVSPATALDRAGALLKELGGWLGSPIVNEPWPPAYGFAPFAIALALAAHAWSGVKRRRLTFEQAVGPAQLGIYCVVLLFTPHEFEWHIDTALLRLLTQCLPAFLAFVLAAAVPAAAPAERAGG